MRRIRIDLYSQNQLIKEIFTNTSEKPLLVHFINTYSIGLMFRNSNYRNALVDTSIFLADGWPLILLAKFRQRNENFEQLRGVNVMRAILANSNFDISNHYFIGSTEQNLINLQIHVRANYTQANIAGAFSPPFTGGDEWIRQKCIDFKHSNSDFVWVSLGTPKQDMLLTEIAECFPNAKSVLAVGAAFDFLTQNQREANQAIIALKLEWLFRLLQEPRRLWRRYTIFGIYFLFASRFIDFNNR